MNTYEEKQARRIERLRERAEKKNAEATASFEQAHKMAQSIPFGQPILVGHHSEKRDRNYRNRMDAKGQKACEQHQEAKDLERRAEAAERNRAISSDDPSATAKLKAKLADLEERQEQMKKINAAFRKGADALAALGISPVGIARIQEQVEKAYSWEKQPYPSYTMKNNGANIRRLKQRLAELEKREERPSITIEHDLFSIVENADENRLQLIFPDKPAPEVRAILKQNGFRWSPSQGAWQRQLNDNARCAAQYVEERLLEGAKQ